MKSGVFTFAQSLVWAHFSHDADEIGPQNVIPRAAAEGLTRARFQRTLCRSEALDARESLAAFRPEGRNSDRSVMKVRHGRLTSRTAPMDQFVDRM